MLSEHKLQERRVEIGHRLREARNKAGWTQEQTANFLGCSRAKINRVEQGETDLTGIEMEILAQAYHTSLTYFFRRLGEYIIVPEGEPDIQH